MTTRRFLPAAAALAAALLAAPGPAAAVSNVVFFGDSLTDNGNLSALSSGAVPIAPYVGGRFSNGPTWATDFAAGLGLPGRGNASLLPPAFGGGNNFAFGLARTDTQAPGLGIPNVINLPNQVSAFATGIGRGAPGSYAPIPSTLFAVWAGANNLLQALALAPSQADPTLYLQQQTGLAVGNLLGQLNVLEDKGARDFFVVNMPNLGLAPRFAGNPTAAGAATGVSAGFNAALAVGLAALDALPGVRVRTLDVFGLLNAIAADPGAFGLADATTPCVTGPVPEIYAVPGAATNGCTPAQAAERLFWDPIHPTAAAHALIADYALAAVPGPAAVGLFGIGLLGLVVLRRRGAVVS